MNRLPSIVAGIYGLCVIASGMWRFIGSEGGETGLWFGIVMGATALLAAVMFFRGRDGLASVLIWIALLVVGGWFVYEVIVEKGLRAAEPRMFVIVALTCAAAVYFLVRQLGSRDPDWKMFVE